MRWRLVAIDVAVAGAAFAVGAAVLAGSQPVAPDLRQPDLGAYALVAVACDAVVPGGWRR